ncbi:MAG: EF-P lysine aminoacylase GenX [Proteobacteria bacterium]|nr:EF-P lysine aminoacylase GenX [Pseudomonadota bacterium]MBU1418373.1 EF-P lysine aminoacylase GenX [Pseudomonadota bacterium]MBU1455369.1 EF-P lysine aminoacylase GenX [Pseudomonadota bacterium]
MLDQEGLHLRAAFFRAIRLFFQEQGFLEVDTPIRQPLLIPEQNIVPIPSGTHFLQSSPELYMKRLLAAGCERIFQICHCFRQGERGRLHLEEFVMLEWYRLDADYADLMTDCEQLFGFLAGELPGCIFPAHLDLGWERLTVAEAFARYCPISAAEALAVDMFDQLLVEQVEPRLGLNTPTFLCDYPLELASLARQKPGQPEVAERFELYVSGIELANGFSELTDPDLQRKRFEEEYATMENERGRQKKMPEHFLEDLGKIEQAAGIAMGLDRLFMLLLGRKKIDDAVSFAPGELDS